jgi:nicotinate phosphoribosyltransferase
MFFKYMQLFETGKEENARRYILNGVRLDTSASLRDRSVEMLGDPTLDHGVNQRLVVNVRNALDNAWHEWDLSPEWRTRAEEYCRNVKIVVSGGFNVERIRKFEKQGVPVDIYAVGSAFYENHGLTKMDFTADVVRVKINDEWVDMAKIGRKACDNPEMEKVW